VFVVTVLHEVIEVDLPVEEVFEAVADFANAERWDPGVRSARRVRDGDREPTGEGAVYDLEVVFRGKTSSMRYTTTRFVRPHEVELRGVGPRITAVDTIRCTGAEGGGTRVAYTADLRLRGVAKVAAPLLTGAFRTMGERALAGMDAWLRAPRS
jgi:carbon monoxide dehydrogenase subunit G